MDLGPPENIVIESKSRPNDRKYLTSLGTQLGGLHVDLDLIPPKIANCFSGPCG